MIFSGLKMELEWIGVAVNHSITIMLVCSPGKFTFVNSLVHKV